MITINIVELKLFIVKLASSCFFLYIGLLIITIGCNTEEDDESKLVDLFHKEKALNCKLEAMKDSISGEWDRINVLLGNNLPADMPIEEKNNMLKVRNANLIRMFQSYDSLDESTKSALTNTEYLDTKISRRITEIKGQLKEIEMEMLTHYNKISQGENENQLHQLKVKYKAVQSLDCATK